MYIADSTVQIFDSGHVIEVHENVNFLIPQQRIDENQDGTQGRKQWKKESLELEKHCQTYPECPSTLVRVSSYVHRR